ncbi:signal transduction histidine kinase [Prauserella shujinwangii]|uniref:Signal transduction histidine kinase n=1 Tax=Prauserella shujinwangii TaxID=1453103 RepID=A0A2T0LSX9_9PSEU|nr:histidine kinase [Prauserella shujinwangii]PRX46732.1 signal transduction histidine kinase [Prauserella shujinwangii]
MRESRLELWGALSLCVVCLLVGIPVLLEQLTGGAPTTGPAWLWWACYLGYLGTLGLAFTRWPLARRHPAPMVSAFGLCAVGTVLLAPRAGWTAILLVVVAAIAAHLVSRRATLLLIAGNSAVVALVATINSGAPLDAALSALIYATLQACAVWAVWSQLRETAATERLAVANTELRAATALLAESSRSAERLRIARELHDLVGHQLTALVLELEVASHRDGQAVTAHVLRARRLTKDLLGDVRTAVGELRGRAVPLRAALAELVADLPRPRVHLAVDEDVEPDEAAAATLIRCTQEVVTNAIRHSEAENLWIRIARTGAGTITLRAHDDGRGAPLVRTGNGLTGLRERVEQLGGAVSFDGRSGFQVEATVPVP